MGKTYGVGKQATGSAESGDIAGRTRDTADLHQPAHVVEFRGHAAQPRGSLHRAFGVQLEQFADRGVVGVVLL
jgi:hypothetical protein